MGCTQSTPAAALGPPEPTTAKTASPQEAPTTAPTERPRPRVFALMRNGHEVIRGGMVDIDQALALDDSEVDVSHLRLLWQKLTRWMELHMAMEEGSGDPDKSPIGMFRLLDKHFDGVATAEGLPADHEVLHAQEKAFTEALADGHDLHRIRQTWAAFATANEAHLKKEESIMMPKVMEFVKEGHNLKDYMKQELLAAIVAPGGDDNSTEMEFFVKYANDVLERHDGGMPRVRVFDHALWAVSSEEDWKKYDVWIKDTVSPKLYLELQEAIKG